MHLTPRVLVAAYEFFRASPPFNAWRLPPADDVAFRISTTPKADAKGRRLYGSYTTNPGFPRHTITITAPLNNRTPILFMTMAHEMVHLAQYLEHPRSAAHGATFQRMARRVCRQHGFDYKTF